MDNRFNNHYSVYISSITIYQWIFCALGIAPPPPPFTRRILPKAIKWFFFILYCIYCLGIAMAALIVKYILYGILNRDVGAYKPDCLTIYLSYLQGVMFCTLNFVTLYTIFGKFSSYTSIMEIIVELEEEIKATHTKIHPINWRLFKTSGGPLLIMMIFFIGMIYGLLATSLGAYQKAFMLYYLASSQTKSIECGLYIHLVSEFLGHIHTGLRNVMTVAEDLTPRCRQLPWPLLNQIIKNQMLLNRIWCLVQALEKYYAWPILLLFYLNGLAVLVVVDWAYTEQLGDENPGHLYFRGCYVTILLGNLFWLCNAAENCIKKYKEISMIIHNFHFLTEDRPLLMRFREYSLQMKHQKLLFTCNGYLDVNLSTFGKMFLVLTGYIVIMLQFKIEDTISNESVLGSQQTVGKS